MHIRSKSIIALIFIVHTCQIFPMRPAAQKFAAQAQEMGKKVSEHTKNFATNYAKPVYAKTKRVIKAGALFAAGWVAAGVHELNQLSTDDITLRQRIVLCAARHQNSTVCQKILYNYQDKYKHDAVKLLTNHPEIAPAFARAIAPHIAKTSSNFVSTLTQHKQATEVLIPALIQNPQILSAEHLARVLDQFPHRALQFSPGLADRIDHCKLFPEERLGHLTHHPAILSELTKKVAALDPTNNKYESLARFLLERDPGAVKLFEQQAEKSFAATDSQTRANFLTGLIARSPIARNAIIRVVGTNNIKLGFYQKEVVAKAIELTKEAREESARTITYALPGIKQAFVDYIYGQGGAYSEALIEVIKTTNGAPQIRECIVTYANANRIKKDMSKCPSFIRVLTTIMDYDPAAKEAFTKAAKEHSWHDDAQQAIAAHK